MSLTYTYPRQSLSDRVADVLDQLPAFRCQLVAGLFNIAYGMWGMLTIAFNINTYPFNIYTASIYMALGIGICFSVFSGRWLAYVLGVANLWVWVTTYLATSDRPLLTLISLYCIVAGWVSLWEVRRR